MNAPAKNKGFTLIELMIAVAIIAILAAILMPVFFGKSDTVSYGYNGVVETRCIEGYKYIVSPGSYRAATTVTQMLDGNGKPVPCTN